MLKSVELFAGAGGLALGVSKAGFEHEAVVEIDGHCCATLQLNKSKGFPPVSSWPIIQADVRRFEYSTITPSLDLLAAGVPCQPFSLGGKHLGHRDQRDILTHGYE